ncbi:MAG TPA: YceI family protein [Longimicrobiales bacterium]|nr:YceI family protein [Longimicrobiales bacterium]
MSTETLSRPAGASPQTDHAWNVDPTHSAVSFSVKHFFTPTKGHFDGYTVELDFDRENPENSAVRVTIPVAGIETGNDQRNGHLLSGDFFDAEAHPEMTFVSERVEQVAADELLVKGPLTIKGITHDVDLPVKLLGVTDLPEELQQALGGIREVASFEAALAVDRRDFGVGVGSWAATAVVGSTVNITIALEANR